MSRKTTGSMQRQILPDRRFGSHLAAKFINCLMYSGEKTVAEGIFYTALEKAKSRIKEEIEPLDLFRQAVENIKPMVEVKSRRVGGANYQVPVEVRPERRQALAFRWLIDASRARGERTMADRLAAELSEAYNKGGNAFKKREDTHRMAEANKAFAHYRW